MTTVAEVVKGEDEELLLEFQSHNLIDQECKRFVGISNVYEIREKGLTTRVKYRDMFGDWVAIISWGYDDSVYVVYWKDILQFQFYISRGVVEITEPAHAERPDPLMHYFVDNID